MAVPKLYRRRFIPNETVLLKDDVIISCSPERIVTSWRVLKPRHDFDNGCSCYFLDEGFKVSRFFKADRLIYTYCDIIETEYDADGDIYTFNDMLVDVIVQNDGFVKLLDLYEVPEALNGGLISIEQAKATLLKTDKLLSIIYAGRFDELTVYLDGVTPALDC